MTKVGQPRVCLATTSHPADYSRFCAREARSLARAGYQVMLIGTGDPTAPVEDAQFRIVRIKSATGLGKLSMLRRIHRYMIRPGCDVIQCLDPWVLAVGLVHKHLRPELRLVYESSEWFPQMFLDRAELPAWFRRILWLVMTGLERAACRLADAILETNETRAERFRKQGRRPVLVPNYPPVELLPEWQTERRPWIAYTGLVSPHRGFNVLVRALQFLVGRYPGLRLRVIGGFEPHGGEQQARQLIAECRLDKHVDFLDSMPYAEMFANIGSCLAGVILLQPQRGNDYTGLPNKLFEFMGAGLGVVASDFPELGRVVRETGCGWLVDPTSPDAIAQTVDKVLSNPEECIRRGRLGRDAVLRLYNWQVAESALLRAYEEILA
ncbi:MAG: glycosyltransferase family 4 protein [candidate division WOR-3 bacterium]